MRFVVLLLAWLVLAAPGRAQVAAPPPAPAPPDPATVLAQAKSDLGSVSTGLHDRARPDSDIEARLAKIPPIQARLVDLLSSLTPRQQDLQARIAQLGSPPAAGSPPEDPQTAQLHRDLSRKLATVNGEVAQARLLSLTADQVSADLSERLRGNFAARLWTGTRSILDPELWRDFAKALPDDLARFNRAVGDEASQLRSMAKSPRNITVIALALIAALALAGPARVALNRLGYRRA